MKNLLKASNLAIFFAQCALLMCFSSSTVTASQTKNLAHDELAKAAEDFVYQQLTQFSSGNDSSLNVSASSLDSRIDVPECSSALVMSASDEALRQSNITVRASCPETNWYLYLMVKATRVQPVVVLTQAMSPGSVISERDVKLVMLDKNLIRTSTFADVQTVVGARLKRRSRPGQPVVPSQLCFVCKGDSILITATGGGVSIKASGIAQQDGNLGDTIAVRNTRSNILVHAQVVDTNQVEVQI